MSSALIYAIHGTHHWWSCIGRNLGFDRVKVLTDRRGQGDTWCTDAFYAGVRGYRSSGVGESSLVTGPEVDDVIRRCRVLRWMRRSEAVAMVLAMAEALDGELEDFRPSFVVSFPIDNYVQDILARLARRRGVAYFELAISPLPDMCMLLHRGKLIMSDVGPADELIDRNSRAIANPTFAPIYVQNQTAFDKARFLRTMGYFRLRGAFFKLYSWWRRDPLNIHYLDAQPWLGHKATVRDIRITKLIDEDWLERIRAFPRERRAFLGLQLFPEASIDYWLEDSSLLDQEGFLTDIVEGLSASGFSVVVKDHPLQFGFRQSGFVERLKLFPNVVVAPYDVSGNMLLSECGVTVTSTGTLGLQAAMLGNVSVAADAYYVTEGDFVVLRDRDAARGVVSAIEAAAHPVDLAARQHRIVERLLRGSFVGDFISFRGFDPSAPQPSVAKLGTSLGARLMALGPAGEDWHRRNLPVGGGSFAGSPLN